MYYLLSIKCATGKNRTDLICYGDAGRQILERNVQRMEPKLLVQLIVCKEKDLRKRVTCALIVVSQRSSQRRKSTLSLMYRRVVA